MSETMNYGTFPKVLLDATEYLSGIVQIDHTSDDGRVNSIADEGTVIRLLSDKYGDKAVQLPPSRCWYDVRLFGYPIQIKSSDFDNGAADNFSSKLAILYALTTTQEDQLEGHKWKDFESALFGCRDIDNGRDHYIISIDKGTSRAYLASLKSLSILTPASSNLPFQINWAKNTSPEIRNHAQAYDFIVGAYKTSVKRKLGAHPYHHQL
jgi:hypothetical protein